MKTSKNKRRRQLEQSGRPVLVTFYVIQLRRDGGGGGARATSSHDVGHHHHRRRRRQHQYHLHGGRHDERRRWNGGKFPDNRRADLLEYSRQLRALARQPTTTAAARPPATPRRRQLHDANTDVAVCGDEGQPAAVKNRLERAMSQPQIRQQRCFGGDWWSWKRVLVLIFPIRNKPRGPRRTEDGDDSEKNRRGNNQKGWSAALPVGKLTVAKTRRDHGWFAKKLMSVFQKRS